MNILDKLPARLFWDTDPGRLDAEKHKKFIIIRVMERGDMKDVQAVWDSYSRDDIREALTTARYLEPKTIAFFSNQFAIARNRFRAYRRRQHNQGMPWP